LKVDIHRWRDELDEKRQAKEAARAQAEQARQRQSRVGPSGSGSGSSSDPFVFSDESRQQGWRPFGQSTPPPEPDPTQQRSRGPRR
jgi:hypothetical protein